MVSAVAEKKHRKTVKTSPCQSARLTAEDVRRVMITVVRSKKTAGKFLKTIGVTFDKNGNSVVTPL